MCITYKLCLNKKAPNLASCSFNKYGLIFEKQHQQTLRNDIPIQHSFPIHFYLLYLLLNSNDRNDTMLTSLDVCKYWYSAKRTKFW